MPKIGAHVSIAGGIWKAVVRIASIGGNTVQIFTGSPRSWQRPEINIEDEIKFKKLCREKEVSPVFIHAKYLISLGNEDKKIQQQSIRSLVDDLEIARRIEAKGVIFHPQGKDFGLLVKNIKKILDESSVETCLIVENTAQNDLAWTGKIFDKVTSEKLRFCFDTAHAFEAGYNLKTRDGFDKTIEEFDREIGLGKLIVVHANDSKTGLASGNDKHENIGDGEMGLRSFAFLLNDKRTRDLPFILETPGFKNKDGVSDKSNIERLKSLIKRTSLD